MFEGYVRYCVLILYIVFAGSSAVPGDVSANCDRRDAWKVLMDIAAEMIGKAKNNVATDDSSSACRQKSSSTYMEIAAQMIEKARIHIPQCDGCINSEKRILDCSDLLQTNHRKSGVYDITPAGKNASIRVYCDMETDGGGWTVLQRRGDFGNAREYFHKEWRFYKRGFGHIQNEFWLGNENIFSLTSQRLYSVRFDLVDLEGNTTYAHYDTFWIDDEDARYALHISNYSGDAGDAMTKHHNNRMFSARDLDHDDDRRNCAHDYRGGWWHHGGWCFSANLNGAYIKEKSEKDGLQWYIDNKYKQMSGSEIKIRPKNFRTL